MKELFHRIIIAGPGSPTKSQGFAAVLAQSMADYNLAREILVETALAGHSLETAIDLYSLIKMQVEPPDRLPEISSALLDDLEKRIDSAALSPNRKERRFAAAKERRRRRHRQ